MPGNTREMSPWLNGTSTSASGLAFRLMVRGDGDGASRVRGVLNDATSIYFAWGPRERLRGPMVRRVQGRGGGRRVPDAGG